MVKADVIVDLQAGDTGKGKVAYNLMNQYGAVMRYNGGGNAGHTIHVRKNPFVCTDKPLYTKVITHQLPCGVLGKRMSIIGPECVVNIADLEAEIRGLELQGFSDVREHLMVDYRAHVVTDTHLEEDGRDVVIGTTKKGIGPAYMSKIERTGIRVGDLPSHNFKVCDVIDVFYNNTRSYFQFPFEDTIRVLCEGAQGYQLDVNFGKYPFVTASHCVSGAVCLNGIPPNAIEKVIGVMKVYETYVGNDPEREMKNDPWLEKIQELGGEIGATTGRKRKVNWLNLNEVVTAIQVNGVTEIYVNKIDILEKVDKYGVYADGLNFISTAKQFQKFVESFIKERTNVTQIRWSRSAQTL